MLMRVLAICAAMLVAVSASAQSGYQIQPGDQLSIEVVEDPTLNRSVLVLPDGSFTFPLVGRVTTSGRTPAAVQSVIASGLAPNFAAPPTVYVSVAGLSATSAQTFSGLLDIYVLGEVTTPGKVQVDPGTTLLQFLAESGGFTRFAATHRVQLRRGNRTFVFNYRALEKGAILNSQTRLRDGDVVVVPTRRLFEF